MQTAATDRRPDLTADQIIGMIEERGWVPNIGQINAVAARQLDKLVKQGELAKYKACWNTGFATFGINCMKTVYALPAWAAHVAEVDAGIRARAA
jgi:hypothetical protein